MQYQVNYKYIRYVYNLQKKKLSRNSDVWNKLNITTRFLDSDDGGIVGVPIQDEIGL